MFYLKYSHQSGSPHPIHPTIVEILFNAMTSKMATFRDSIPATTRRTPGWFIPFPNSRQARICPGLLTPNQSAHYHQQNLR